MEVVVSCGRQKYCEIIDEEGDEYFLDHAEDKNFFRSLKAFFPYGQEMEKLNGNHYIYGWWENFEQSDDFPNWAYGVESELFIEFVGN